MLITPRPLILASRSPRRAKLLAQIGLTFTVRESDVEEEFLPGEAPEQIVRRLAEAKALDVAHREPGAIVVGADTIVVLDDAVLGKPFSGEDARRMLWALSGRTHTVHTGFAIVDTVAGRTIIDGERADVTFRRLSEQEIGEYVRSGSPMDKAGAYGIQDDYGAVFVERIDGCYYTIVGFPLARFFTRLRELTDGNGNSTETP